MLYRPTTLPVNHITHPLQILHGRSLAHLNLATWQRRLLAADWCLGRLILCPSIADASKQFDVSRPLITETIKERQADTSEERSFYLEMAYTGFLSSTQAERDKFVRSCEQEIWTTLERVTDAATANAAR